MKNQLRRRSCYVRIAVNYFLLLITTCIRIVTNSNYFITALAAVIITVMTVTICNYIYIVHANIQNIQVKYNLQKRRNSQFLSTPTFNALNCQQIVGHNLVGPIYLRKSTILSFSIDTQLDLALRSCLRCVQVF